MNKVRVISFYLPQYHPIKENDEIWGKGFTEWTNVAKAKPQYRGHYQPQIPSELGFYDLRMDNIRKEQAKMAMEYGIEGFCYWHYWFGNGKKILEMPIKRLLETGEPNFPFCFAWANHSWSTKTWNDSKKCGKDIEFLKQEYLGEKDYIEHFNSVLPYFLDKRYIRVDDKPLFVIFDPKSIPEEELKLFINVWNDLAKKRGLNGIHFVGRVESVAKLDDKDALERLNGEYIKYYEKLKNMGFNAIWSNNMRMAEIKSKGYLQLFIKRMLYHLLNIRFLNKYEYKNIIKYLITEADKREDVYPMIIPRWDKTPRQGNRATIYANSTPELFEKHAKDAFQHVLEKKEEHRIVFLQAWNEWGEGNYMEPDLKYGRRYLEALRKAINYEKE